MRIQVTTPPNTSRENPQVTTLKYDRPSLTRVVLKVPKGHAYLTGFKLLVGNSSLVVPDPSSNTLWIVDDDRAITFNVDVSFDLPSFAVEVKTYNEDDTFSHSHYVDLE